jgi:hypothetical protein
MKNKIIHLHLLLLSIMVLLNVPIWAQTKPLKDLVKETMDLRRKGQYWNGISPFKDYIVSNPKGMIDNFKPYTTDTLESIRSLAHDAIGATGQKAKDLKIRQAAAAILVDACLDKETSIRKNVSKKLSHFQKADFTAASKQKLANLLKMDKIYFQNTVKLIAYLDMTNQTQVMKALLDTGNISNPTIEWDIRLSLARLGDKDAITWCLDKTRNAGLNDKVIYNLFPDLAYTRTREAVNYMIEVLNNDAKNCFSPNPDNPVAISCAYRVMEFLAPIIKNFPLKTDKDGELAEDDYEKALATCREWFKIHANDYVIDREKF